MMLGIKLNFSMISQLALAAATGGASLAVTLQQMAAKAVMQQVASAVIQQIGDAAGLSRSITGLAQAAFGQSSGLGGAAGFPGLDASGFNARALTSFLVSQGMTYTDAATFVRDIQKQAKDAQTAELKGSVQDFIDNMNQSNENKKLDKDIEGVMRGKGSLLMKLAIAMGKLADKKMNDMADVAQKMGKFGEVTGKNQGQYAELNAKMQALGQEFGLISNALSNVIKSVGEGASTIARKG